MSIGWFFVGLLLGLGLMYIFRFHILAFVWDMIALFTQGKKDKDKD
jgi:hypothetical protein